MKSAIWLALTVATAMAAWAQPGGGSSQAMGYQPPKGATPRMPDGKPDFSGVWQRPYVPDMTKNARDQVGMAELPYTEWGLNEWKTYRAEDGDYTGACLPFGFMRAVNSPNPLQIIQNAKYLGLLFEIDTWHVSVPIDGRKHRDTETWFGDSVGHWEGDTLVIDTIGFNGKTKMDTVGHPHSDKLHMIQRFTRPDLGHINYEVTIDDPKTYTKPWKNTRVFTLRPDWELIEYSCMENNKSLWEGRIKVPKF
jgi:hypothetical protein